METSPRRRALVRWSPLILALGLLIWVSYERTLRYHVLPEELEAGRAEFAALVDWAEGELGAGTAPAADGLPTSVDALPPRTAPMVPFLVWLLGAMHSEWDKVAASEHTATDPLPTHERQEQYSSWELHRYRLRTVELFEPLRGSAMSAAELTGMLEEVLEDLDEDDLFGGTLREFVLPRLAGRAEPSG